MPSGAGLEANEGRARGTQRRCARLALAAIACGVHAVAQPAGALAPVARIEGDTASLRFGESVASAGDVDGDGWDDVIVGAPFWADGESSEGAALLFRGGPDGLVATSAADADAVLQGDQAEARLGSSVASAGDVDGDGYDDVIVGAGGYDAGEADEGAAFVWLGGPGGIASGGVATADAMLQADSPNARLGSEVAGVGDVDGDGFDDVAAGGRLFQSDGAQTNEGLVLVFRGGPDGVASAGFATAHARIEGEQAGALFGDALAGAGDVDGDGFDDVLVGATRYSDPEVREGAAFVFLGSESGIADGSPASADTALEGDQVDAWFGASVSGAGDVNGDGYGDIAVGAPRWDGGQSNEGAAFVWLGGPDGIASGSAADADARVESDQAEPPPAVGEYRGVQLGSAVAIDGDADRDGFDDLLVGAPYYDAGQVDEGVALLLRGGPDGIASSGPAAADAALEANKRAAWIGTAVAFADANADGADELLVGAYAFAEPSVEQSGEGAVLVFDAPEPAAAASCAGAIASLLALRRRARGLRGAAG